MLNYYSQNQKINLYYKPITKNIKDYVPYKIKDYNIREIHPIIFPEQATYEFNPELLPNMPGDNWPNEENLKLYNFGLNNENLFTDPNNNLIIFPYSLRKDLFNNFKWMRPKNFLKKQELIKNIKEKLPNKNYNYIRKKIDYSNINTDDKIIIRRNTIDISTAQNKLSNNILNIRLNETEKEIKNENSLFNENIYVIENNSFNKINNIDMGVYYCKFCRWLASVFQTIIDNNINNCSFIKNIYPQNKEGIPIYNPSGKYWIKLLQFGKYRKIEIDDLIPVNKNTFECYFPRTTNKFELWPILLTKGIIKLFSYKYRNDDYDNFEVGDISLFYCLIGYFGYKLDKKLFFQKENNEKIKEFLNEENYETKNKLIIMYSNSEKKTINYENKNKQLKIKFSSPKIKNPRMSSLVSLFSFIKKNRKTIKEEKKKNNSFTFDNKNPISKDIIINKFNKKLSNGIFCDVSYTIIEIFQSKNFNLNRIKPINFSDLKLHYDRKYKQLNSEEKEIYLKEYKKLKQKQTIEKKLRIEEYLKEGDYEIFFKFTNNSLDKNKIKLINNFTPIYSNKEIEAAKFCIVNGLNFPNENYFKDTFIEHTFRDKETGEINFWTRKFYKKLCQYKKNKIKKQLSLGFSRMFNNLDEKKEEKQEKKNIIIPKEHINGNWIKKNELNNSFTDFIFLYNLKSFKYQLIIDNLWYNYLRNYYDEKDSLKIIKIIPENNKQFYNGSIFVLFEPNYEKNIKSISSNLYNLNYQKNNNIKNSNKFDDISLNLTVQLYCIDKYTKEQTFETINLKNFFDIHEFKYLNTNFEYFFIIQGGIIPFGYHLQLFSNDFKFDKYTFHSFLKNYKNYISKKINIFFPILIKDQYFLIAKYKLNYKMKDINDKRLNINFFHNFLNFDNKNLKAHIEIFLINSQLNTKKRIFLKQIFSINFEECKTYFVEISIVPNYNCSEKCFQLEILYESKNIEIEQLDLIAPFQIKEKFIPNNKNLIFNEMIFSTELSYITLNISLQYIPQNEREIEVKNSYRRNPHVRKKINEKNTIKINDLDKSNKNSNENNKNLNIQNNSKIINTKEIPFNVRMTFEYDIGENKIFSKDFVNKTLVRNLVIKGKPYRNMESKKNYTYYIIKCFIDPQSAPTFLTNISEYNDNFYWSIIVFSTEPFLFVKNTLKEDEEIELKNNWEINEPGRALKANLSREKFLIKKKIKEGVEISEEEKSLIKNKISKKMRSTTEIIKLKKSINLNNYSPIKTENENEEKNNINNNYDKNKLSINYIPFSKSRARIRLKKNLTINNFNEQKENIKNDNNNNDKNKLPDLKNHNSNFIKNFYKYTQQNRIIVKNKSASNINQINIDKRNIKLNDNLPTLITEGIIFKNKKDFDEEKNQIENTYNNYYKENNINNKNKNEKKNLFKKDIKNITNIILKNRKDYFNKLNKYKNIIKDINEKEQTINNLYLKTNLIINNINNNLKNSDFNFDLFKDYYNEYKNYIIYENEKEAIKINLKNINNLLSDIINNYLQNNNNKQIKKEINNIYKENILNINQNLLKTIKK